MTFGEILELSQNLYLDVGNAIEAIVNEGSSHRGSYRDARDGRGHRFTGSHGKMPQLRRE